MFFVAGAKNTARSGGGNERRYPGLRPGVAGGGGISESRNVGKINHSLFSTSSRSIYQKFRDVDILDKKKTVTALKPGEDRAILLGLGMILSSVMLYFVLGITILRSYAERYGPDPRLRKPMSGNHGDGAALLLLRCTKRGFSFQCPSACGRRRACAWCSTPRSRQT